MSLRLQVYTPDGCQLDERGLEVVVLRRRERRFERGSEIAVYPGHAPMLIRVPEGPIRYRAGGQVKTLELKSGFAQVVADRVLLLTAGLAAAGRSRSPRPS